MKTRNLLTIAISAFVALNFTSCKENEDDEPFHFPADQVELLLPDGVVVDTTIRKKDIVSSTNPNYTVVVMVGTEKDNLSTFMGNDKCILKIDQKYYWQAKVVDSKSGENSEFSEIRTFYVLDPKMKVTMETDNGETESAIVLRWSGIDHNKYKNIKVQMKPTKECGFAGKTFEITNGQDSLYIRLADNPEIPYMFNDFDDLHGINYEPVIYNFILTADVVVADKIFQTHSRPIKEIFLNKKNHVRDHEYNVYRVVEVGDQIWLADDLRCTSYINYKGDTIRLEINKDYVISKLQSGAEGVLYEMHSLFGKELLDDKLLLENKNIGPKGFHMATFDDWRKLEKTYAIEDSIEEVENDEHMDWFPLGAVPEGNPDEEWYIKAEKHYMKSYVFSNLFSDIFASKSDWITPQGNYVYNNVSVFNIKPFGYQQRENSVSATGLGIVYYATPYYLICFHYSKEGMGVYQTEILHNRNRYPENIFFAVRFVTEYIR